MTTEEFEIQKQIIINEMTQTAGRISQINKKYGSQIAAQVASIALATTTGIKIQIPSQLGWAAFGVIGAGVTYFQSKKLKPYLAKMQELETRMNKLIEDYNNSLKSSLNTASEPVAKTERSANTSTNNNAMIGLGIAGGLIVLKMIRK